MIPIFALFCLLILASGSFAQDSKADQAEPGKPDVLVAVLTGVGPQDNVVMDYAAQTSPADVQQDLTNLQKLTGWSISDAQTSMEQPSVPGAKATTGATFTAPGIVNPQQGALPIEPFVTVLKRFENIEIDYIVSPEFTYQGIKDFENDYVKIKVRQKGTTYQFFVTVKDNDFETLDLPVTQVEQEQSGEASSMTKLIIVIGVALLAAVVVFLVIHFVGKRRQQG